jgi:hypothetical protein
MLIVMRRAIRGAACILALAAADLAIPAASALASPADLAATQSYIHDNYALVHAAAGNIQSSEAGLAGVLAQVRRECPRAAAGSPQDHDSEQLSDEVVGAIVVAGVHPNVPAIESFIGKSGHLRWSSRALTSKVQGYVGKLKSLASLAPPSLCADVAAWAAGGYQTLPASTVRFDAQYTPVWVALGELPGTLRSFERPEDHALVQATNRLENEITAYEARAVETYASILDALELKQ